MSLQIENLSISFDTSMGRLKAVDDISFVLHEGKTTALVGESGSGKSVTALSIMGILDTENSIVEGKISFEKENLLELPYSAMKKIRGNKISMIFQEPMTALNPVFQVGYQLGEVLTNQSHLNKNGNNKKDIKKKVIRMMESVGLPDPELRYSEYPHQLSGGMKQRIMIAMALLNRPSVLIADEPTTALDVTIQAQILELISDLKTKFNTSVLLITHDLGVVAERADWVHVMYAGKIVESGPVEKILSSPNHPYTQALLSSLPSRISTSAEKLKAIKGQTPPLNEFPLGCRFSGRCEQEIEICADQQPVMKKMGEDTECACHLYAVK